MSDEVKQGGEREDARPDQRNGEDAIRPDEADGLDQTGAGETESGAGYGNNAGEQGK